MIRLLRTYFKPYWLQFSLLVVFQMAQSALNLYLPNLSASLIDQGVASGSKSNIYYYGWWMIVISLLQIIANVFAVWLSTKLAARLGYEVRRDFFANVQRFSLNEIDHFSTGSLITRATNDIQQVQNMTMQALLYVLQAPVMFVGGLFMAIQQNARLSLLLVIILPTIITASLVLLYFLNPLYAKLQRQLDTVNRLIREQISGVRVIRAFVRENTESERFDQHNTSLFNTLITVGRINSFLIPVLFFIISVSNIAIMWFGGKLVDSGQMEIGALIAFIQYLMVIMIGFMMAAMMSLLLPRAMASARRINEVLDTTCSVVSPKHPYTDDGATTAVVEFKNVSFGYEGAQEPVINDISFTALPGQTTAFIGSTASGKSTVLRLLQRMFDVNEGHVLINGHDVREYDYHHLTQMFGTVPQKAVLFLGTVRSNMLYGNPNASDEEIWEALRIAQAEDFIRELSDGLDSHVAQGGSNFSGGQKQRLCIARAILRNPLIYTFDDSFSALDMQTDKRLREALQPITRQATQLVVAQRASSIRYAEQIIVLDHGTIVGKGTHDELLRSCEVYQEIVESQGGQGPDVESLAIEEV